MAQARHRQRFDEAHHPNSGGQSVQEGTMKRSCVEGTTAADIAVDLRVLHHLDSTCGVMA